MQNMILFGLIMLMSSMAIGQSNTTKITWTCWVKKTAPKTVEVHMTASIDDDCHLYAQDIGGNGPIPTTFTFLPNPLLTTKGKVKEEGQMIRKFDSVFCTELNFYERKVDFIQLLKVNSNAKTNFSGKVDYVICNNYQCWEPLHKDFKINIGNL